MTAAADFLAVLLVSTFLVATLFTARLRRDLFVPPGDLLLLFCFSAPCLRCVHSNPASSPPQGSGDIVFWAQTQTTPPPSKAFASSVMFVEEEAVAFDVVVAAKSLSRFFGSGRGNILATLGPRQLATRA